MYWRARRAGLRIDQTPVASLRIPAAVIAACAALAALPAGASAEPCGTDVIALDSGGYRWDTPNAPATLDRTLNPGFATLTDGGGSTSSTPAAPRTTDDSYDSWGTMFVGGSANGNTYFSSNNDSCVHEDGGRELAFPSLSIGGLQVQRKLYVSASGLPGARLLELVHNPGPSPVTTSVQVGDLASGNNKSDLGSDNATAVRASSSGATTLRATDNWMVTSDDATTDTDFALAHVYDGPGGSDHIDFVALAGTDPTPGDNLAYRWNNVAIAPGQTAAFISYEIQQGVADGNTGGEVSAASQRALAYQANPLDQIYAGMSDTEIAAVRNWAKPRPSGAAISAPAKVTDAKSAVLSAGATASSLAGHCQGASFAWNFGDGASGSGQSVAHRFAKGARTVTLTVSNSCGESTTVSRAINVVDATRPSGTLKVPKSVSLRTLLKGLKIKLKPTERVSAGFTITIPSALARKAGAARISRTVIKQRATLVGGKTKTLRLKPTRKARANLKRLKRKGVNRTTLSLKVGLRDTAKLKRTLKTRHIKLRF